MRHSEGGELRQIFANDPHAHDWDGLRQLAASGCERTLIAEGSTWTPTRQPAKNGLCVRR